MQWRSKDLCRLRGLIAASSRLGTFRITAPDASILARAMQVSKGIDPAMAIYAAYAYHDLGRRKMIEAMSHYMQSDLGLMLFDVGLLARRLDGTTAETRHDVFPPFPALSPGWSLLRACRVSLAPELNGIERHLESSLWTLFSKNAVPQLEAAVVREP